MPPKLILKKPSPTSFSLEIPINLLGFEDGSKKNKTKRHFKFTENGFFYNKQNFQRKAAVFMMIYRLQKTFC